MDCAGVLELGTLNAGAGLRAEPGVSRGMGASCASITYRYSKASRMAQSTRRIGIQLSQGGLVVVAPPDSGKPANLLRNKTFKDRALLAPPNSLQRTRAAQVSVGIV